MAKKKTIDLTRTEKLIDDFKKIVAKHRNGNFWDYEDGFVNLSHFALNHFEEVVNSLKWQISQLENLVNIVGTNNHDSDSELSDLKKENKKMRELLIAHKIWKE